MDNIIVPQSQELHIRCQKYSAKNTKISLFVGNLIAECTRSAIFAAGRFLMKIILEIHAMEQVYIKLPGIYSLSCQVGT